MQPRGCKASAEGLPGAEPPALALAGCGLARRGSSARTQRGIRDTDAAIHLSFLVTGGL